MKKFKHLMAGIAITIMTVMPATSCSSGSSQGQDTAAGDGRQSSTMSQDSLIARFMNATDSLHAAFMPAVKLNSGPDSVPANAVYDGLVAKLSGNRDKYVTGDTVVNTRLLYDDVVTYLKEQGCDVAMFESGAVREQMQLMVDKMCNMLVRFKGEKPTIDEFTTELVNIAMLFPNDYTEQELRGVLNFSVSEHTFCCTLTEDELRDYARKMSSLIMESGMNEDLTEFYLFTFQMVADRLLGR